MYHITSQYTLEQISRHCPEALGAYLHCINRANKDGVVFFSKKLIEIDMSESMTTFRNNIKKLARENLLIWHPLDDGLSVALIEAENANE